MKKALALMLMVLLPVAIKAETVSGPQPSVIGTAAVGQIPGTSTNDNAAPGDIGAYFTAISPGTIAATVTITIANPAVITLTGHGLGLGSSVYFTTSGSLPTGITANTQYWVIPVNANTFEIATSPANAVAGTAVATSGTQSGTQTVNNGVLLTTQTPADVAFLSLPAGDYQISGSIYITAASGTTVVNSQGWLNTVSQTIPTNFFGNGARLSLNVTFPASTNPGILPIGTARFSLPSTTIVYVTCQATFTVSTSNCYGYIQARVAR